LLLENIDGITSIRPLCSSSSPSSSSASSTSSFYEDLAIKKGELFEETSLSSVLFVTCVGDDNFLAYYIK
jgi:hypothetical protein